MEHNEIWAPFGSMNENEEDPFYLDTVRTTIRAVIRMTWMSTPGLMDSKPLTSQKVKAMEMHLRSVVDDVLKEFNAEADQEMRRQGGGG